MSGIQLTQLSPGPTANAAGVANPGTEFLGFLQNLACTALFVLGTPTSLAWQLSGPNGSQAILQGSASQVIQQGVPTTVLSVVFTPVLAGPYLLTAIDQAGAVYTLQILVQPTVGTFFPGAVSPIGTSPSLVPTPPIGQESIFCDSTNGGQLSAMDTTRKVSPIITGGTSGWSSAASWTIDANAAGADASSTTTIQTHAEYRRRIGPGSPQQNTTISLPNGLGASDTFDTFYDPGLFTVTYTGTLSTVLPGQSIATAGYTARVVSTNTPNQLKIAGGAFSWGPYIGQGNFIRMSSGAANGLLSSGALDQTANVARVGSFLTPSTLVESQPSAGDTFDIVLAPTISCTTANMRVQGGSSFIYQNLRFLNDVDIGATIWRSTATALTTLAYFNACCFAGAVRVNGLAPITLINCQGMTTLGPSLTSAFLGIDATQLCGGVWSDSANRNYLATGRISMRRGCLFQGASLLANAAQGVTPGNVILTCQDVGFFDVGSSSAGAIQGYEGTRVLAQTTWGNTGTGNPVACKLDRSSKLYLLGTAQTLTNGGGQEIAMPLTANTTWAAARTAGGIWDGDAGAAGNRSDASIMVVL